MPCAVLARVERRRARFAEAPGLTQAWSLMVVPSMPHVDPAARLAEWASRGPRYTSYPPATEFRALDATLVRRELERVAERRETVSLYVHVPFCRSLCWYCGCNVIPTRDATVGVRYVAQLADEMKLLASSLGDTPITELALGGGSPNFLSPASLHTLFAALEDQFAIAPDARRSIELDPRTTTSAQVETLAAARFRSLSMGVQDFSEAVQDAIHRHQTKLQTRWVVERARAAGFDDVNVDVVYGLPLQTETSFARTLDAVVELAPDRIALFGYAHLPDKLPHQRLVERAGPVLDSYERATLLLLAIEQLTSAGYLHLGLDHFARPGSRLARAAAEHRMVRTFQGYAEHRADAVLGLGVSAISSTPRMHWQSHPELPPWSRDVAAGAIPVARGVTLNADDRARRAVIGRLMCDGEVDLGDIGVEHELDDEAYFAREIAAIGRLSELATYDRTTHKIRTTELGRMLVRNVCMVFDRYHRPPGAPGASQPQFSPTI
jgi:oxygen-independent coproporphyrinogen III oxidase